MRSVSTRAGWRLDADFAAGDDLARRAVHAARVAVLDPFRQGTHDGRAGLSQESLSRGVRHRGGTRRAHQPRRQRERGVPFRPASARPPAPGPDPKGDSYGTFATFSDPDGNSWLLQEIKTRLPGRGLSSPDVATLTELLREAETHHGAV